MLPKTESPALGKLRIDINRSLQDHAIRGKFSTLKLLVVIDFWPVCLYRLFQFCTEKNTFTRKILRPLLTALKPIVDGISGARIYLDSEIGAGLLLHQSTGVIVAPGAVLGTNCTFFSGACVVHKGNDKHFMAPKIGNDVRLMAGCKVIGDITIGDNVSIGANAVVTNDVPSGSIAVGVPAKVIKKVHG